MKTVSCKCGKIKLKYPLSNEGKLYRIRGLQCRKCGSDIPEVYFKAVFHDFMESK